MVNKGYWLGKKRSIETNNKIRETMKRKGIKPKVHWVAYGKDHPNWKGGRHVDKDKYIRMVMLNHPFADKRGRVYEHRLLMEKKLGRYLHPKEVVDHINNIKNDNRIENLRLFSSNGEHLKKTIYGK